MEEEEEEEKEEEEKVVVRRLRKTSTDGPPGMATRVRLAYHRRFSGGSSIACRSTWLLSSVISSPYLSQCHDRYAK